MKNNNPGTIIIVGASSGLGHAISRTYARRGWKVGVCARREDRLRELAAEFPGQVEWQTLDVTVPDSGRRFTDFVERLGGTDIVLYAAGCGWNNPYLRTEDDERTVATNVDGFTRIINAAFNWFADNQSASGVRPQLCAITSIAGTKGIGISATYSATKRYQNTYLQAISQLARTRHINLSVTDIRPGFIDTALLDTTAHHYPLLMNVDYATRRIVRAIDRRRRVAYIDWRWHAVVIGWRLIPSWIWRRLKLKI